MRLEGAEVVVTGATGNIGIALCAALLQRGASVLACVRPGSPRVAYLPTHPALRMVETDIADDEALRRAISHADVLFHLAWMGTTGEARQDEALQRANFEAGLALLRLARDWGAACFVGAGSQAEYGPVEGLITEDTPPRPQTQYGAWKLRMGQEGAHAADMRFVWPRIFSVYGPYDVPGSMVMGALGRMLAQEDVPLTRCTQLWDYLYVSDAAEALISLVEREDAQGTYNLSGGDVRSLRAYVEEMREVCRSDSQLLFGAVPYGPGGPVGLNPSIERIKADTGWRSETEFAAGIRQTLEQSPAFAAAKQNKG